MQASNPRPLLIHGGPIHAQDGTGLRHAALVVRDGRIAGVGSMDDMSALAGADAQSLDLAGATVMPGLVDTHPHLLHFAARRAQLVDLSDAASHGDIVARIAARAKETPKGQWIVTTPVGEPFYFIRRSWRDLPEGRLPDRRELDQATPDHPVFISAYGPVTPNLCVFNSAGLAAVGITSLIPDRVCDVWIDKDDRGRPTGILRGSVNNYYSFDPFWTQILARLPGMAGVDVAATTRQAMADYNALGVTSIYEGHNMTSGHVGVYQDLHARAELTVRVMAAMETQINSFAPFEWMDLDEYVSSLALARSLCRPGDDWLRIEGATLAAGGPAWPGLLRMHEPYNDPYGRPTTGITFAGPEIHDAFVTFCAEHGLRANFCNAGDRDHDDVLAALSRTGVDARDRHWLIQHAIVIRQSQVDRLAEQGFDFTTSMSFLWGKGDMYGERLGKQIWRDMVPLNRLVKSGRRVGCGSDWGPKNLFEHILLAETQEFAGSGHRIDDEDHAVNRATSIALWTDRAAEVLGWPELGNLRPGHHADLVVLDRDPFSCSQDDLPGTAVQKTMLAGNWVYEGPSQ